MDYAYYSSGTQPPYHQFMGISPLTPSHNSAGADDFTTTSSPVSSSVRSARVHALPPSRKRRRVQERTKGREGEGHLALGLGFAPFIHDVFEQFPQGIAHEPFQHFENYGHYNSAAAAGAAAAAAQPTYSGPPTPPHQQHGLTAGPVHPVPQPMNGSLGSNGPGIDLLSTKAEEDQMQSRRQGSSEQDEMLTPAQNRRKEQNRAAQRAFRERKERHVKDLETQVHEFKAAAEQKASEIERLNREVQKLNTENEILRATSTLHGGSSPGSSHSAGTPTTTGPLSYNPTDFYSNVLQNHNNKTPSHRIVTSDEGERLLAAGATWDLIMQHELFRKGLVDIQGVSDRLKNQAKCDGQGPVFEERAILEAIRESVASGSDELL